MSYTIPYLDCCAADVFGATEGRPNPHRGQDVTPGGPNYPSWVNGVVAYSGYQDCLGNVVVVRNDDDGYFVGISHLASRAVSEGQRVSIGTGQGPLGNTGSCSFGRHGHVTVSPSSPYPWTGPVIDPVAYAREGAGGGEIDYHWYGLTGQAMYDLQRMMNVLQIYGGVDGGTGPEDSDFGERSVKGMQELGKRWGYLAGDYLVDGIPHNADKEAPSNYGYFLQQWARDKAGYDGLQDGLPAAYTSEYLSKAANIVIAEVTGGGGNPTPEPPKPTPIPDLPLSPAGYLFMPDLGTTQGSFDFAEYAAKGGLWVALKMGGSNASDSPYVAPAYLDQLNRARTVGMRLVHYWFNGDANGVTPTQAAEFFFANSPFLQGDVIALDIEDEDDTGTKAWTPAKAMEFARAVDSLRPGLRGLLYMSDSLADREEWDELVAYGWKLWSASWGDNDGDPNEPPVTDDWPEYLVWQYTSNETVPGNYVVENGVKVYPARTDGNLARSDLFDLLGWVKRDPDPGPGPDPEPGCDCDELRKTMHDYLAATEQAAAEAKAALE